MNANKEIMHIFSDDVLHMIKNGRPGWDEMVPPSVAEVIKKKQLFSYQEPKVLA